MTITRSTRLARWWRYLLTGTALVGAILLTQGLYIQAKAKLGQLLLERSWQAALSGAADARPWPWADTQPVARLLIPGLGVDQIVLDDANGHSLAWGPARVLPSSIPGRSGHSIISGHSDTHFSFVSSLAPGDALLLIGLDGLRRDYEVVGSELIDTRLQSLAIDANADLLTLVTCQPAPALAGPTPYRLLIHAVPRRALVAGVR